MERKDGGWKKPAGKGMSAGLGGPKAPRLFRPRSEFQPCGVVWLWAKKQAGKNESKNDYQGKELVLLSGVNGTSFTDMQRGGVKLTSTRAHCMA